MAVFQTCVKCVQMKNGLMLYLPGKMLKYIHGVNEVMHNQIHARYSIVIILIKKSSYIITNWSSNVIISYDYTIK